MPSSSTKSQELKLDVEELQKLCELAKRQKVKDIISLAARRLETELISLKEEEPLEEGIDKNGGKNEDPKQAQDSEDSTKTDQSTKKLPESQIRNYSWDQSDKFVKIYLTGITGLENIDADSVVTDFSDQSVNVRINNIKGRNLTFNINKTCHKISPEKSYHKCKSDYLLVCLAKLNPGSKWSHMTHAEKTAADVKKAEDAPKVEDNEDPSAGLMKMMKKMYDEGDDEMKRTIAKAWTEGQEKKGKGDAFPEI